MTIVRDARRPSPPPRVPTGAPAVERRPFRDNPRLILLGIVLLFAALAAMIVLADRSPGLNPDFLSEVVLYALSAADLTMLLRSCSCWRATSSSCSSSGAAVCLSPASAPSWCSLSSV